jgi:hypothetical protein
MIRNKPALLDSRHVTGYLNHLDARVANQAANSAADGGESCDDGRELHKLSLFKFLYIRLFQAHSANDGTIYFAMQYNSFELRSCRLKV